MLVIEKSDVRQFALEHPSFALKALKLMARKVRRHAHLVEVLSFHEVGQRLALLLLAEAQPTGKDHCSRATFHLSLSNHEVAIRIGSVRARRLARSRSSSARRIGLPWKAVESQSWTLPLSNSTLKPVIDAAHQIYRSDGSRVR